MKLLKTLALLAALSASVNSYAIDKQDAGEYVLLDINQKPTPMRMRYYLEGNQWIMDGKQGNSEWSQVCGRKGDCRLKDSQLADIKKWRALLPDELQKEPFSCIDNKIAFAFCHSSKKENPQMRLYWWIGLVDGQAKLMHLNRIN